MQEKNIETLQKFAVRLRSLRNRRRLTQSKIAEGIDVSNGSVAAWETAKYMPRPDQLEKLLKFFAGDSEEAKRKLQEFLLSDTEQPLWEEMELRDQVSPDRRVMEMAPVVSWASAGLGGAYGDLEGYLDEAVETDCKDPNKYALIVEGDSMLHEFKPGDRIVMAPNIEPQNGDEVVARLQENGRVFFKIFHERSGGKIVLTSYNQAFPPLEFDRSEFRFVHPVWGMVRRRKGRK